MSVIPSFPAFFSSVTFQVSGNTYSSSLQVPKSPCASAHLLSNGSTGPFLGTVRETDQSC